MISTTALMPQEFSQLAVFPGTSAPITSAAFAEVNCMMQEMSQMNRQLMNRMLPDFGACLHARAGGACVYWKDAGAYPFL